MKKLLKPRQPEESVYYSDFSGKCFESLPHVEIRIEFNYGSKRDGDELSYHLTEEEAEEVLKFIQSKLIKNESN